ncbi:hypothetical protein OROMI_028368 [Orobanche minor]
MANIQNQTNHPPNKIPLAVIMVPLPAQGHLNQLLHLSRRIAAHNIPVHFAASSPHNRQARTRVHGFSPSSTANIHFHDLPTPDFENPNPNPDAPTKFPIQIIPSLLAAANLRRPVFQLAEELSSGAGKLVVIYDSVMAHVVQDIHSVPNAESYCFHSISAFSLYSFFWKILQNPNLPAGAEIVTEAAFLEECFPPEFSEISDLITNARKFNSGDIFNTSRIIEGLYVDLLAEQKTTGAEKNWALGPFNPVLEFDRKGSTDTDLLRRDSSLEWLDRQGLHSAVFVSFGTTSSLSDEQISEIASGLERSEEKFLWVLRDADKGNVFEGDIRRAPLPEGFESRVEGRGMIVRDWAPQLEILGHPSIGGFMSHCGWNSCMESISMGKPIIAWPMHSDQPKNAVLMTKVLRIGVQIKDWARRDEVISSDAVEKAVRRLMSSDEGNEMRRRSAALGDAIEESLMEGGVSSKEMDSFLAHIARRNP